MLGQTISRVAPNLHALGAAVRESRARRGLSQERLGVTASLHRNYIGAIERGTDQPDVPELVQVASELEVPLSELVGIYERNASAGVPASINALTWRKP